MRIAFMGATELGWNCCEALIGMGEQVVGIFSIPQQFKISWSSGPVINVQYKSFEDLAEKHSIPLVSVTGKLSDPEYRETLRELRPDMILVVGWYYMLPRSLRELAPLGAAGLHASLLPKYRGGAPLVWATINGETETGVSFFYFADGADDGDIIGQASFHIDLADDISDLIQKASQTSLELIRRYVPLLSAGEAPRIPQKHDQATFVPQRKPEDGLINWHALSAKQAYDWVRAQTRPYPGAFTFLQQERVTIWKAGLIESANQDNYQPGTIVVDDPEHFAVCCADSKALLVKEVGLADGSSMTGTEFRRKRSLRPGVKFDVERNPLHLAHA